MRHLEKNMRTVTRRNMQRKYADLCPRLHIHIKPAWGNGESDSLCGKICDMHTLEKYANNAAIAYLHKTGMPNQNTLGCLSALQ